MDQPGLAAGLGVAAQRDGQNRRETNALAQARRPVGAQYLCDGFEPDARPGDVVLATNGWAGLANGVARPSRRDLVSVYGWPCAGAVQRRAHRWR